MLAGVVLAFVRDLADVDPVPCGFRFNPAGCSEVKPARIPI